MRVGFIRWDGGGGGLGRTIAVTDDNSGDTVLIDFTWAGTYTVNPDGTGTLNVTTLNVTDARAAHRPQPAGRLRDIRRAPKRIAMVINKANRMLALNETDNAGGGAKIFMTGEAIPQWSDAANQFPFTPKVLRGRYAFQVGPATGFSATAPGDPGNVAGASRQDILRVGVIQWDGISTATGHTIATTDDNAGSTIIVDFNWVGTYTVNSDGTGTLNMTPYNVTDANCTPAQAPGVCTTLATTQTYAFSLSKARLRLYLAETDHAGVGAKIFMAGEARRQ